MSGKKFRFSLQSVLDLRQYEAGCAEQELQAAVAARREQEILVERTRQRLDELSENAPDPGRVDLQTLRQYDAFRQHARRALQEHRAKLKELREREVEIRTQWMEKRQAEDSLQTLHDQEKEQHQKEQSAAELAFIDEQSVMRFSRDNRASLL